MLIRHLILFLLTFVMHVLTSAIFAAEITVALTATVDGDADDQQSDLMSGLLDLLQAEVSSVPALTVVERRQISLALHELTLSRDVGKDASAQLMLGKIASADLIVTLQLKSSEKGTSPKVLVRIVESLTGVVRGISMASIADDRIDRAANQIAGYLRIVATSPAETPVTVAVAPFECKGRFDRLRPLELGLRDMFTRRLIHWSDTLANESISTDSEKDSPASSKRFHVLQRSSMQELLSELDLIQSAMADRSRLPSTLPSRAAAFFVQGSVNEVNDNGEFRIVVAAELLDASSGRVVQDFKFTTAPRDLEVNLAHCVDLFAGRLAGSSEAAEAGAARLRELNETKSTYEAVLADLRRFRRRNPIYFGYTDFALKGRTSGPPVVEADSLLGRSLLRKCIARLEVALFVDPDNMQAAYALGYCLSFHIDGIRQPERADRLLRKVGAASEVPALRAEALKLLAEISFHHRTGRPDRKMLATAAAQVAHGFTHVPFDQRDVMWARMIELFDRTLSSLQDEKVLTDLAAFCRLQGENKDLAHRGRIAAFAVDVSKQLLKVRDSPAKMDSRELEDLLNSDDLSKKEWAARELASVALREKRYTDAAAIYLKAAGPLAAAGDKSNLMKANNLRFHAAKSHRVAGDFAKARALLESFSPVNPKSLNAGYRAVELAQCYAHDGETERARDLLIHAAENVWALTQNTNIEKLIAEYGGVPLRDDREIDVEYVPGPNGEIVRGSFAVDGSTLLLVGQKEGKDDGIRSFDTITGQWAFEATEFGKVSRLMVHGNRLWAATESGLWYRERTGTQWSSITTEDGLPDNRVAALVSVGDAVYAGIGTRGAGGVVRIDPDGSVIVQSGDNAPASVAYSMAVFGNRLVATTQPKIHELNLTTGEWSQQPGYTYVFEGKDGIWSSRAGRELEPYGADSETAQRYEPAWFDGYGKSGYGVSSIIEKHGQIWLCGGPWQRFSSSGFYRFEPRTRDFVIYGPRDGFRADGSYRVTCGAAIGDHFWLATTDGLAKVTPRLSTAIPTTTTEIRHELFLRSVEDVEVRYDDTLQPLDLHAAPLMRRTSSRNAERVDAELFAFTDRHGVPRLVVNASFRPAGNLFFEVTALSCEPIWGKLPHNDKWRAETSGSGKQIAKVQPGVEAELGGPDAMMRKIANSIQFEVRTHKWIKSPLRSQPLYRFTAPKAGVSRGALFGFGFGNDADAVLLVWQETESQDWCWLAGASTSRPLRCSEEGTLVWEKEGYWSRLKTGHDPYVEVLVSEHPDLVERTAPQATSPP